MDGDGLEIARDHHPPGEYAHNPSSLIVSVSQGAPITLEQISDGRTFCVRKSHGSINVLSPGLPRVFRHRDGCHFVCVTMPFTREVRPLIAVHDEPLRLMVESLAAAADAGDDSQLFRDAVARAIVVRLEQLDGRAIESRPRGLQRTTLSRVVEYMDAHLADDISVTDLARVARMSPAHFSTVFQASFGEPPHRHLVRLRVERARQLLERGIDPAEAALAVGFYDQSHLGRHMRRLLGVTPGAIARAR